MSRQATEANLLSHTRDMLLRHVARTKGRWPRSWDDMAADFEPVNVGYGTPSLEVLESAVAVDFELDLPQWLATPANPDVPTRVFWLRNSQSSPAELQANARLRGALQQRQAARAEAEP